MMKPDTENESASYVDEAAGKREERSSLLTRTDQVNQRHWSSKFTTFAVGVGIGALVGLLFAPASGKKTRNYITRTVKQGLDDAASAGKRWSRRAQETVEDAKANVAGVVEAGQKAYRAARDA
jgi:gas vesicle protein